MSEKIFKFSQKLLQQVTVPPRIKISIPIILYTKYHFIATKRLLKQGSIVKSEAYLWRFTFICCVYLGTAFAKDLYCTRLNTEKYEAEEMH